jgi:hypothetical protein
LFEAGGNAGRWLWSITGSTFDFLKRQFSAPTAKLHIGQARFWQGLARPGARSEIFASGGGLVCFDPSGDAVSPLDRISVVSGLSAPAQSVDIFDASGARIRSFDACELGAADLDWAGEDDLGRIVPDGMYTVIDRAVNGRTCSFSVEVKWHQ